MTSSTGKLIDAVVRQDLAKRLKADGFKKYTRTFVREVNGVSQIVNVQASQGNFEGRGQFTMNLGVYFPAVAVRRGLVATGAYPKEYESTCRRRIGQLMPERKDHWWEIGEESAVARMSLAVGEAYAKYGRPWLDEVSSLPSVLEPLKTNGDTLGAASVALELGRAGEAEQILQDGFAKAHPLAHPMLRRFAARNGLTLNVSGS